MSVFHAPLRLLAASLALLPRVSVRRDVRQMEGRLREEEDRATREHAYFEARGHLSQLMLAVKTEEEVCGMAREAIESRVTGASVVVLSCDGDADQLDDLERVASKPPPSDGPLQHVEERSCLAVRLGVTHACDPREPSVAWCQMCGPMDGYRLCQPLLAGGQVVGSMLVTHPRPLTGAERRMIDDTIAFSSPVLANLRNLARAERRAQTDPLTGLPNRRALDEVLKLMLAQAHRTGAPLAIVLADIDGFKRANDTLGHDRGDALLSTVAGTLARSVRASDFVGRFGGDEFVVVLAGTNLDGARIVAEKMAAATRKARVIGLDWPLTASFGVAGFPDHGMNLKTVIRSADGALYQGKQDGRDCVTVAAVIPLVTGAAGSDRT